MLSKQLEGLTEEQILAYVRALQDNPVLKGALESMEASAIETFQKSAPEQQEERERAYWLNASILLLREKLERTLTELTKEEKPK